MQVKLYFSRGRITIAPEEGQIGDTKKHSSRVTVTGKRMRKAHRLKYYGIIKIVNLLHYKWDFYSNLQMQSKPNFLP